MFPIIEAFGKPLDQDLRRDAGPSGSRCTRPPRSRATARPTPSCRPTTSSPTSSAGTRATWTSARPRRQDMLEFEYARAALKRGLKLEAEARHQPVQVRHDRLHRHPHRPGHRGGGQLLRQDRGAASRTPSDWRAPSSKIRRPASPSWTGRWSPSGYAAVWATENTREALFDAMERARDLRHHRPAHGGALLRRLGLRAERRQRTGMPADARLRQGRADGRRPAAGARPARRPPSWSPRCRTRSAPTSTASRSSRAGWTRSGKTQEKVYDVAWSGDRKSTRTAGKLPPVGNTVDVAERHLDQHHRRARS